ncbi:MAG: hypothetical protein GXO49_01050 [Chlorobi bacterium]|nr:hypothetical protein [Chlorobiota bacterium]
MLNFFKNIFKTNKQNFENNKDVFKNQVEDALKKCKEDKKQQVSDIDKIRKWAKDIIFS